MNRILLPLNMWGLSFISVSIPLTAFTVKSGSSDSPVFDMTSMMNPACNNGAEIVR